MKFSSVMLKSCSIALSWLPSQLSRIISITGISTVGNMVCSSFTLELACGGAAGLGVVAAVGAAEAGAVLVAVVEALAVDAEVPVAAVGLNELTSSALVTEAPVPTGAASAAVVVPVSGVALYPDISPRFHTCQTNGR